MRCIPLILMPFVLLAAAAAPAQWSADPQDNLLVGYGPGDQVVPHVAVVPPGAPYAGFAWVGFYDTASGNYDVALQFLAPDGTPVFSPGGIVVSAHVQDSWVMDWGLAADGQGHAVLAFADIRDGNSNIHAYRISPEGDFLWGPDGITLSAGADFKGAPTVGIADDGQAVVAWMQSGATTDLRMQRLTADGTPLLAAGGGAVSDASDLSPFGYRVLPAPGGDVLVGYIPTYSFMSNRLIKVQRFDATGTPVWAAPVMVMDDGTLPMGHAFDMTPDGVGGALFCWTVASGLDFGVRVQRVTADGDEVFAHNGLWAHASGPTGQIGPSGVYDPATGHVTVGYVTMSGDQNLKGAAVQRFDAAGNRLWGAGGSQILPQDSDLVSEIGLVLHDGAVMGAAMVDEASAYSTDRMLGLRLGDAGDLETGFPVRMAEQPSVNQDMSVVTNGSTMVAVWDDDADVAAQNLNADGTLGHSTVGVEDGAETGVIPAAVALLGNYPNPFNPATRIVFELPRPEQVRLRVYDAAGRLVRTLVETTLDARRHEVVWDGTTEHGVVAASGTYLLRLDTGTTSESRPILLVK